MKAPVLITGGAGFVGTNLAHRLLSSGTAVRLLDDLSRSGSKRNLRWLREVHGRRLQVEVANVRDRFDLAAALSGTGAVVHLAAQVAVTTSLLDPVRDFEVNLKGTLNLLEELRRIGGFVPVVFASTNKVYGDLGRLVLEERERRYGPLDAEVRATGIDERAPLDLKSPYGCSKGAADQYVLDYARSFSVPATVFRLSCTYGPHQSGTEDQGWVAHFMIRALAGEPVNVFGNGKQVRDVLFVGDLVEAITLAFSHVDRVAGEAFNIGGGPDNTLSLLELIDLLGELGCGVPDVRFDAWRQGDQPYYVSDIRKFQKATGWAPRVSVREGLTLMRDWLQQEGVRQRDAALIRATA